MSQEQSLEVVNDKPHLRWLFGIWRIVNSCILIVGFINPWVDLVIPLFGIHPLSGADILIMFVNIFFEEGEWVGLIFVAIPFVLIFYILANIAIGLGLKFMTKLRRYATWSLVVSLMSIGLLLVVFLFSGTALLGASITLGGLSLSIILEIVETIYKRGGFKITRRGLIIASTTLAVGAILVIATNVGSPRSIVFGNDIYYAAWSPDGTRLVTVESKGIARVWDATSGEELAGFTPHQGSDIPAVWSPDGTRIATPVFTVFRDKMVRVWDAKNGSSLFALVGDEEVFVDVAWSPDGMKIVTGNNSTAQVWDAISGTKIILLADQRSSVGLNGGGTTVAWSPDGTRILTKDLGGVRVWDAVSGVKLSTFPRSDEVAWSPDGTRIVTAGADCTARVYDAISGKELAIFSSHTNWVTNPTWSPDGKQIATASWDGVVWVWDAADGSEELLLTGSNNIGVEDISCRSTPSYPGIVNDIAWSPDGTRIVTAMGDGTAIVWDAISGAKLMVLRHGGGTVMQASWSPDGSKIVTVGNGGKARLWQLLGDK